MHRHDRRTVCKTCKRNLPRAATRCPWCAYGIDSRCGEHTAETAMPLTGNDQSHERPVT
jgi:predicted amidophosphoribosyltransferase